MTVTASEVYVVRHGETDWNVQRRIQGHTDIPLNSTGIRQANALNALLADVPFSAAFSSDLSRAQQTAEVVVHPRLVPIKTTPALRERSAGKLEGQSVEQLNQQVRPFFLSKYALEQESYLTMPWHPELETSSSVIQRVMNFILSQVNPQHPQTLLVVSHSGVLRSLLDYLSFNPLHRWVIANCGFIKIKIETQTLSLLHYEGVTYRSII